MAKAKSGYSKGQWAKNKKDRVARQMGTYWKNGANANYQNEKIKSIGGKKLSYKVRTDKRGRKYIADMGADAPEGYYSDGSRYYKLKRNATIARDSTEAQKNWYFTHHADIMGADPNKAGGYLDNAGRQGMIGNSIDGYAEVNLRKTERGRKSMDPTKAYYGHAKKSRYIFKIGQDGREA